MQEFEFKRCAKRCASTDREICAGEKYYSALIEDSEGIQRLDFAEAEWDAPPDGCIGWWKSRIPVLEKGKIYWAPNRVLIAFFETIAARTDQIETTYVMALLLVRKRLLQWKDNVTRDGVEFMKLRQASTKKKFEIKTASLTPEQIKATQNELAEQLFTDQAEETDDTSDEASSDTSAQGEPS